MGLEEASRMREIGRLELRARALENEVGRRAAALDLALREREDALKDFIENGLEGIQWVNQDGRVLFSNICCSLSWSATDDNTSIATSGIVAHPQVLSTACSPG